MQRRTINIGISPPLFQLIKALPHLGRWVRIKRKVCAYPSRLLLQGYE